MAEHRGRIRVGTAGWSYADWNGVFYPKPMLRGVDRLTYITRYFDVVEINSTFYRPADPKAPRNICNLPRSSSSLK